MIRNCYSEDDFFAYHPTQHDFSHPWNTDFSIQMENKKENKPVDQALN